MTCRHSNRTFLTLISVALLHALACGGSGGIVPVIASNTPSVGTIGTIVTIDGSSFQQSGTGTDLRNPTVTFTPSSGGAGFVAPVTSFSTTSLDVAVPAVPSDLAASGTVFDITVSNPGGGSATSKRSFTMATPVITDVNGGVAGSGTPNSLFIVDGTSFGDLTAAPASGYSVNFSDASTGTVVASAAVDVVGGNWQDIFVVGTVPGTLAPATTYQLTVTTPSGTSAPATFLVLANVSFSPSTIAWTATSPLPVAQQGFPTVIAAVGASSYAYALGGNVGTPPAPEAKAQNVATVWYAPMNGTTGAVGAWTGTTPLPDNRGFSVAVGASPFNSLVAGNGNLYVLGGLDGTGNPTSTVYYASLASDGTVPAAPAAGSWATTTPLPQPLFATTAVIFHGRIYVAGGNDATGTPVAKVYSARILADGTLDQWETHPDLPVAVAYHQLVTSAGYLYVLGGDTAAVDPVANTMSASEQGSIYDAQINIRNGALVNPTWTTNAASMGKVREKFTAVVAGSYILVSGGLYNGASTGSSEQSYAQIDTDGSIASFNGATGSRTISGSPSGYPFFDQSGAYFVDASGTPHILVLGGQDVVSGTLHAGVWYQH
jgi:hypothetical protein